MPVRTIPDDHFGSVEPVRLAATAPGRAGPAAPRAGGSSSAAHSFGPYAACRSSSARQIDHGEPAQDLRCLVSSVG